MPARPVALLKRFLLGLLALGLMAGQALGQTRTLPGAGAAGSGPQRLALVVGVDAYQHAPALRNAVADAETMAGTLNRVGYEVRLVVNASLRELQDEVIAFADRLKGGDEVVLFFSGHGVQIGGTNYLLPRDVRSNSEAQVRNDSIALSALLADLRERKPRFTLAIIDACRDNPFQGQGRNIGGRGLAGVSGADGQMVIYAAGEGQQALDRLGPDDRVRNGVFTRVFARQMLRPGVPVHEVLRSVRDEVHRLAQGVNHNQVPAIYDQMLGSFYFVPPAAGATVATPGARPPVAVPPAATGTTLEDLEREEQARREWARWQQRMQADFDRVAAFQGSADLQVQAWQRFLGTWAQDNPGSPDDEALRQQARLRLQQAEQAAQAVPLAAAAPARPPAIPLPSPAFAAAAGDWPAGPLTFVVPFAPGGPTDKLARDLAEAVQRQIPGSRILVENVAGAGGTVAATRVARAAPDGRTYLFHHIGMATTPVLFRQARFNPLQDFEFLGLAQEMPLVLVGRPTLPAGNWAELRRWLEAQRGRAMLANAGLGSASHLCGLALQEALDLDFTVVPYKGAGPALTDLLGGQVDLMCDVATNLMAQVGAGRVKAYAWATAQPPTLAGLAHLPSLAQQGLRVDVRIWHGLYAPRGTPAGVLARMNEALRAAVQDPVLRRLAEAMGAQVVDDSRSSAAGHRRFVEDQLTAWTGPIRRAGQYAD